MCVCVCGREGVGKKAFCTHREKGGSLKAYMCVEKGGESKIQN